MFGRKKKSTQPPAGVETALTIFGGVVVPKMYETFVHDGFEIVPDYGKSTIKNFCTRCGGDVKFDNTKPWDSIMSSTWICGDCAWIRDKYEKDLSEASAAVEELEGLEKNLFAAFRELLGRKPASLGEDDLREAGLILHRDNSEAVLGFILIDYSRGQMHELVTAVDGRLEPFSRGFKLYLAVEYYKLFPGSYWWSSGRGLYMYYIEGSYLDNLRDRKAKIESKAEPIQARISEYQNDSSEVAPS